MIANGVQELMSFESSELAMIASVCMIKYPSAPVSAPRSRFIQYGLSRGSSRRSRSSRNRVRTPSKYLSFFQALQSWDLARDVEMGDRLTFSRNCREKKFVFNEGKSRSGLSILKLQLVGFFRTPSQSSRIKSGVSHRCPFSTVVIVG